MDYKKIIKIFFTVLVCTFVVFLAVLYVKFYNESIVQTYNKAYFVVVEKTCTEEEEINLDNGLIAEGYVRGQQDFTDEYIKRFKEYLKVTDYSKEGIVCENVWVMGRSDRLSKYAVIYDDGTVSYITGHFTPDANFYSPDFEFLSELTGKEFPGNTDISNTIFVNDIYERKTIKLSKWQKFILMNKLKLINLFEENKKDFPLQFVMDYTAGFYLNELSYSYEDVTRPKFFFKLKMNAISNCDDYITKCLGYKKGEVADKSRYWIDTSDEGH